MASVEDEIAYISAMTILPVIAFHFFRFARITADGVTRMKLSEYLGGAIRY